MSNGGAVRRGGSEGLELKFFPLGVYFGHLKV